MVANAQAAYKNYGMLGLLPYMGMGDIAREMFAKAESVIKAVMGSGNSALRRGADNEALAVVLNLGLGQRIKVGDDLFADAARLRRRGD